jgi:diguanylate cyclase (GGDEF)-like protein/PAS domain S-box-containing protein
MYYYYKTFMNDGFNHLDEGIYFTDANKKLIYWNNSLQAISGFSPDQSNPPTCCQVILHIGINGEKLCDQQCPVHMALQEGKSVENSMFIRHKEGHLVPVTVRTIPVYKDSGQITGVIEVISDRSHKKRDDEKVKALTKAAYIDSLTGLVNKQYIESRLQAMLREMPAKRESFGILYININGFRTINEVHGVSTADKVFKMVANTLSAAVSPPHLIGRWHGASFIAILDTTNKSILLMLASKMKLLISESIYPIHDSTIQVTVSTGYAGAQSLDSLDYLIERATKASLEDKSPESAAALPEAKPTPLEEAPPKKLKFHILRST